MFKALREEVAALEAEVSTREAAEDAPILAASGAAGPGGREQHQATEVHAPPVVALAWVGLRPPIASPLASNPLPLDSGGVEQRRGITHRKQADIDALQKEIAALDALLEQAVCPHPDEPLTTPTFMPEGDLTPRVPFPDANEGVRDDDDEEKEKEEEGEEEEEAEEAEEEEAEDSDDDEAHPPESLRAWLAGDDNDGEQLDTLSNLKRHNATESEAGAFLPSAGVAGGSMVMSSASSEAAPVHIGRERSITGIPSQSRKPDPPYDFSPMRVLQRPLERLRDQKIAMDRHVRGAGGEHVDDDSDHPMLQYSQQTSLQACSQSGGDRIVLGRLLTGSKTRESKMKTNNLEIPMMSRPSLEFPLFKRPENPMVRRPSSDTPNLSKRLSFEKPQIPSSSASHEHDVNSGAFSDDAWSVASVAVSSEENRGKDGSEKKKKSFIFRFNKPSRSLRTTTSVGSTASFAHDGDKDEENGSTWVNFKVYRNAAMVFALFLADCILFIVLEIIWTDSVCTPYTSSPGPGGVRSQNMQPNSLRVFGNSSAVLAMDRGKESQDSTSADPQGEVLILHRIRWEIVTLKAVMSVLYLLKICTVMRKTQRQAGRQYLRVSLLSAPFVSLWIFLLLVLACASLLVAEGVECSETSNDVAVSDELHRIQRAKVALHLLRVIFAWNVLIHRLQSTFRRKLQTAVSQNRRRFYDADGDFNLDLTYICDRLLAMSLPCVGGVFYRNDIRDIGKFFATFHYGSFQVVNLCEAQEESGNGNYDPTFLYNQVKKFPMRDHNICGLRTIVRYCEHATKFLNEAPDNVIAVHCQGGKGRTGSFCSSLMLWTGLFTTAGESLGYFAQRRTDKSMGANFSPVAVTSPSQLRYVHYLESVKNLHTDYISKRPVLLTELKLSGQPHQGRECCNLAFVVENGTRVEFDYGKAHGLIACCAAKTSDGVWSITLSTPVVVDGDVSIRFFWFDPDEPAHSIVGKTGQIAPGGTSISYGSVTGKQLIFVQFHTAFATETMVFPKRELDGAYNKGQSSFAEDFALTVKVEMFNKLLEPARILTDSAGWEAESERQHALYTSLSYAHRLATSHHYVARIMKRLCPEGKVFRHGDAIYNPVKHKHCRALYFVEKGNVVMMPTNNRLGFAREDVHKGTTSIGEDLVWGSGEFLNLPSFILGQDFTMSHTAYAYSETVIMRVYTQPFLGGFPGRKNAPEMQTRPAPLKIPVLYPHDMDILYETMAYHSILASMNSDLSALAKIQMEKTTKRGQSKQDDRDLNSWKATLVHKTRAQLGIPLTETCIHLAEVRMHKGSHIDEDTKGTEDQAMKKPKLRHYPWLEFDSNQDRWLLLVFAKRLICVDESSNFSCMSSEDISSVKLDSNLLVIKHSSNLQMNSDSSRSPVGSSLAGIGQQSMWSSAFNLARARSPAREKANLARARSPAREKADGGFSRSISPARSFRIVSKVMMGTAETLTPGKPRKVSSGFDDIQDLSTDSMHRLQDSSTHSPCMDTLNEASKNSSTLARTPSSMSSASVDQSSSSSRAAAPLQRVGRKWARSGSNSSTKFVEGFAGPHLQDSGLKLIFRDPQQARVASHHVTLLMKATSTTVRDHVEKDVHPMALLFGLVSTDKTTGNLLEEVSTEEIKHLRSFFDECTSGTGPLSRRWGGVLDSGHFGGTGALTRKVFAKDQVVMEIGTVKKCIICVVAGSLSARSKDGTVLVKRGPGEVIGEWGYFSHGNHGASADIVADEDDSEILEISAALVERIRVVHPQLSARLHRTLATLCWKRIFAAAST